jgi:hypothetical protein
MYKGEDTLHNTLVEDNPDSVGDEFRKFMNFKHKDYDFGSTRINVEDISRLLDTIP